ncbi:hypothetical protein TNCV_4339871 [Trichonephila clavipes]|nr:hypothetical protein TNCV_4339871 [Trichonephila clavipes]
MLVMTCRQSANILLKNQQLNGTLGVGELRLKGQVTCRNGQEIKWAETNRGGLRTRDQRRNYEARDGGRREVYKESERVRKGLDLREPFGGPSSERIDQGAGVAPSAIEKNDRRGLCGDWTLGN